MVGQQLYGTNLTNPTLWIREQSTNPISTGSYFPSIFSSSSHLCSKYQRQDTAFMAATMATMAILNPKCLTINSHKNTPQTKPPTRPISLPNLPLGLVSSKSASLTGSAIAGAVFSTLSFSDAALAAQQIADIAEGDNRGLALLLPVVPAIAWVLYNILQPALNQLDRMRSEKGVIIGLGLGGLTASGLIFPAPEASAAEIAAIAEASGGDNRGTLLLFVVTPAILWVLYNILQPALNQLNRMRSD